MFKVGYDYYCYINGQKQEHLALCVDREPDKAVFMINGSISRSYELERDYQNHETCNIVYKTIVNHIDDKKGHKAFFHPDLTYLQNYQYAKYGKRL